MSKLLSLNHLLNNVNTFVYGQFSSVEEEEARSGEWFLIIITTGEKYPCLNTKYLSGILPQVDYNTLNNEDGCSWKRPIISCAVG